MRHIQDNRGFTIVELMISTAVFSMILLVILAAIAQIGRMYYKGISVSKTQENTRSIIDRISQEIQYSSRGITPTVVFNSGTKYVRCIGSTRLFYTLGEQNIETTYGLWMDESGSGSPLCASGAGLAAYDPRADASVINGRDILSENMRIAKFDMLNPSGDLYTLSIRVVYGDTDLLTATKDQCLGSTVGTQFCAVSQQDVTVLKRL